MKKKSLRLLFFAFLLSSCNRGVYVTIDNKKYNYGNNTIVTFTSWKGNPPGYGIQIKAYKKSDKDSAFFSFAASKTNTPVTVGDYSFSSINTTNLSTSTIEFNDNKGKQYMSGSDKIYGPAFIITSLTKKRAKGYFKSKLVDTKADTIRPSNTIYVEGRFNVSLKNAQHY